MLEAPGTGPVQAPAPKVLPPGYELAADYLPAARDAGGAGGDGEPATDAPPGACSASPIAGSGKDDKLARHAPAAT